MPSLQEVQLLPGSVPGVPSELLSSYSFDNCLDRLRGFFASLDASEPVAVRAAKAFVLGNGSVGKTQLTRLLCGLKFDENVPTTHGVDIIRQEIMPEDGEPIDLNLWDFGGQPLYHGTHALFLKDRSVYVIAWSPDHEDGTHEDRIGGEHENHPLDYWVDYAISTGGAKNAVLFVQTRCDDGKQALNLPLTDHDRLQKSLSYHDRRFISAKKELGRSDLIAGLARAADHVLKDHGYTVIPRSWQNVIDAIDKRRPGDCYTPTKQRQDTPLSEGKVRTLSKQEFEELATTCGVTDHFDVLLHYLNAIGAVFYRPKLFEDQVIVDQNWALEGVYAVLTRGEWFTRLLNQNGRFDAEELKRFVWDDQGYTDEEQQLFLRFMISCGMAFENYQIEGQPTVYIAPSALPSEDNLAQSAKAAWREDDKVIKTTYPFPCLHDGLLRSVIAAIGNILGESADYWNQGVQIYARSTPTIVARVYGKRTDKWQGNLTIETRFPTDQQEHTAKDLHQRIITTLSQHTTLPEPTGLQPTTDHDNDQKTEDTPCDDGNFGKEAHPLAVAAERTPNYTPISLYGKLKSLELHELELIRLSCEIDQSKLGGEAQAVDKKAAELIKICDRDNKIDQLAAAYDELIGPTQ
ncbi:MAG: COR domain-containing protein [Pseudomonadota bacterium]